MQQDFDLYLGLAEIAGVFVGFGALITLTRAPGIERGDLFRLGAVVSVGLYVIVGASIPLALARYGVAGDVLWRWSAAVVLLFVWLGIGTLMRIPRIRAFVWEEARVRPVYAFIFWVFLEIPVHVALLLVIFGVLPALAAAFYTTALVLALLEGAMALSELVYLRLLEL